MFFLYLVYLFVVSLSLFLCVSRFLNCLIILENFNVLVLLFCLLVSSSESHMLFVIMIVMSTVEVVVGLVVLTRVWECSKFLELGAL